MSWSQQKFTKQTKKHERMAHSQGKNNLTETIAPTDIQTLKILVKDAKSTFLNMFCELNKTIKRTKWNQENNVWTKWDVQGQCLYSIEIRVVLFKLVCSKFKLLIVVPKVTTRRITKNIQKRGKKEIKMVHY